MLAPDVVRGGVEDALWIIAKASWELPNDRKGQVLRWQLLRVISSPANGKHDEELIIAIASCSEIEAPGYEGIL